MRNVSEEIRKQRAENLRKHRQDVKGMFWFTDGNKNIRAKEQPIGFYRGFIKNTDYKYNIGKHWYNNGLQQIFQREKPVGWHEGQIKNWWSNGYYFVKSVEKPHEHYYPCNPDFVIVSKIIKKSVLDDQHKNPLDI